MYYVKWMPPTEGSALTELQRLRVMLVNPETISYMSLVNPKGSVDSYFLHLLELIDSKVVIWKVRGVPQSNEPRPGKTKTQISFAVTAKLISAFVFASRIVQSLYFLNTKFQASSYLLWLYSPVCVGPGRKSRRPVFSQRGSNDAAYGRKNQLSLPQPR